MSKPVGHGSSFRNLYRGYQRHAKRKEVQWKLSEAQFHKLTKGVCHYCGIEPSQVHRNNCGVRIAYGKRYRPSKSKPYVYNGIDRKNNDKGYTINNSVSCCWVCNKRKSAASYGDFMSWIKRIGNFQRRRKRHEKNCKK